MTAQAELFPDEPTTRGERKVALAVKRDVRKLKKAGELDEREGLAETLVVLAEAVDRARKTRDTWAAAAAGRELRQVYALLGPTADPDEFEQLIRELSTPLGDTPQP